MTGMTGMTGPLSPEVFRVLVLAVVGVIAVLWVFLDTYRLVRELRGEGNHDKVFGCIIGLVIAAVGLGGVAKNLLGC